MNEKLIITTEEMSTVEQARGLKGDEFLSWLRTSGLSSKDSKTAALRAKAGCTFRQLAPDTYQPERPAAASAGKTSHPGADEDLDRQAQLDAWDALYDQGKEDKE